MTLSPLLQQYFFHNEDQEDAIRVFCPHREQRESLLAIAKSIFDNFVDEYLHSDDHYYIFWNPYIYGNRVGFDGYISGNDRTYNFEDFIKEAFIIEDEEETNILDVEELL